MWRVKRKIYMRKLKKSAALSGLEQNSRDKSFFVCKISKIIFISNNILLQLNIVSNFVGRKKDVVC